MEAVVAVVMKPNQPGNMTPDVRNVQLPMLQRMQTPHQVLLCMISLTGWFKVGGTSLASPLVAGIFATGVQLTTSQQAGSFLYGLSANHFHDVTKGNNGLCSPSYLCKAAKGYDGPTGLGSP